MIKALREEVPEATLEFFRDDDPDKNHHKFWGELATWYLDPQTRDWHADWGGFCFPKQSSGKPGRPRRLSTTVSQTADGVRFVSGSFIGAAFVGDADLSKVQFHETISFYWATFARDVILDEAQVSADFSGVTVGGSASFRKTEFSSWARFYRARFNGDADFEQANFPEGAEFAGARFSGTAGFRETTFGGPVNLAKAELEHGRFVRTVVKQGIYFGLSYVGESGLHLVELGNQQPEEQADPPRGPAALSFGPMSLEHVTLRSLDASEVHFAAARHVEDLAVMDVDWPERVWQDRPVILGLLRKQREPEKRRCIADEGDLETPTPAATQSREPSLLWADRLQRATPLDVERVYSALRNGHERQRTARRRNVGT